MGHAIAIVQLFQNLCHRHLQRDDKAFYLLWFVILWWRARLGPCCVELHYGTVWGTLSLLLLAVRMYPKQSQCNSTQRRPILWHQLKMANVGGKLRFLNSQTSPLTPEPNWHHFRDSYREKGLYSNIFQKRPTFHMRKFVSPVEAV